MPHYQNQLTPEEEKIGQELDELYPKAKSKTEVVYKGKKYQIRYFPMQETAEGEKVKEWGHRWIAVNRDDGAGN